MKYFIAIEDELLLKLWMLDPQLVAPLSRRELQIEHQTLKLEVKSLGSQSKMSETALKAKLSEHQNGTKKGR